MSWGRGSERLATHSSSHYHLRMLISLGAQESGCEQIAFTLCIFSYAIIILKYHLNGDKIFMLWTYQSLIWPFFFYCGVQWHGLQFCYFGVTMDHAFLIISSDTGVYLTLSFWVLRHLFQCTSVLNKDIASCMTQLLAKQSHKHGIKPPHPWRSLFQKALDNLNNRLL